MRGNGPFQRLSWMAGGTPAFSGGAFAESEAGRRTILRRPAEDFADRGLSCRCFPIIPFTPYPTRDRPARPTPLGALVVGIRRGQEERRVPRGRLGNIGAVRDSGGVRDPAGARSVGSVRGIRDAGDAGRIGGSGIGCLRGLAGAARRPARRPPLALDGLPMHPEAARERLDRREQPLLQPDDEQPGGGPHPAGRGGVTLLAGRAVLVEQTRQGELRRVGRQAASRTTLRFGNPPWISRTSSFRRRTITSSSAPLPRTATPRVKR